MTRFSSAFLVVLPAIMTPWPASADTIQIPCAKDSTLYQNNDGLLSNGSGQYLFTGRTAQPDAISRRRAVIEFDLTGIPNNSQIQSVSLQMYMSVTISGASPASLHRVLAGWGEGASDAPADEGGGAPSASGDATWAHRSFNSIPWGTLGGDFAPTPTQSIAVADSGFYVWPSNAAMVAEVQGWLDNPAGNFGWVVIGDESIGATAKRFSSRENLEVTQRPVLIVEFAPRIPATSSIAMVTLAIFLGAAGAYIAKRQRREALAN